MEHIKQILYFTHIIFLIFPYHSQSKQISFPRKILIDFLYKKLHCVLCEVRKESYM
jgi:hypothetical protein